MGVKRNHTNQHMKRSLFTMSKNYFNSLIAARMIDLEANNISAMVRKSRRSSK